MAAKTYEVPRTTLIDEISGRSSIDAKKKVAQLILIPKKNWNLFRTSGEIFENLPIPKHFFCGISDSGWLKGEKDLALVSDRLVSHVDTFLIILEYMASYYKNLSSEADLKCSLFLFTTPEILLENGVKILVLLPFCSVVSACARGGQKYPLRPCTSINSWLMGQYSVASLTKINDKLSSGQQMLMHYIIEPSIFLL